MLGAALVVAWALAACSSEKPEKAIVGRWSGDLTSPYWEASASRRVEDVTVEFLADHTATVKLRAQFKWPTEIRDTVETSLKWTIGEGNELKSEESGTGETFVQKIVSVSRNGLEIEGEGPLQGKFRRQ